MDPEPIFPANDRSIPERVTPSWEFAMVLLFWILFFVAALW